MARPGELAVHVERDDLTRAEPRIDAASIGDRARRSEIVLVVDLRKLSFSGQLIFPELFSVGAAERGDEKDNFPRRRSGCRATAERPFSSIRRIAALHERRMIAGAPSAASDLR